MEKSKQGTVLAFHNKGEDVVIPAGGYVVIEIGEDGHPHGWVSTMSAEAFEQRFRPVTPRANVHLPKLVPADPEPETASAEEQPETADNPASEQSPEATA